jgi:transposase-like protein
VIDLVKARKKLLTMTHEQINAESAENWASLAMVCLELAAKAKTHEEALKWLIEGDDFHRESREHASQIEDDGKLLRKLLREFNAYHKKMILLYRKTEVQDE